MAQKKKVTFKLAKRPFKVCDMRRYKRPNVAATDWSDLLEKGKKRLGIASSEHVRVVLDRDGTLVGKNHFFRMPYFTTLQFLRGGQLWYKRETYSMCMVCKKPHPQKFWLFASLTYLRLHGGSRKVLKLLDDRNILQHCQVTEICQSLIKKMVLAGVQFYWPEEDLRFRHFWKIEATTYTDTWNNEYRILYKDVTYQIVEKVDSVWNTASIDESIGESIDELFDESFDE